MAKQATKPAAKAAATKATAKVIPFKAKRGHNGGILGNVGDVIFNLGVNYAKSDITNVALECARGIVSGEIETPENDDEMTAMCKAAVQMWDDGRVSADRPASKKDSLTTYANTVAVFCHEKVREHADKIDSAVRKFAQPYLKKDGGWRAYSGQDLGASIKKAAVAFRDAEKPVTVNADWARLATKKGKKKPGSQKTEAEKAAKHVKDAIALLGALTRKQKEAVAMWEEAFGVTILAVTK